MSVTTRGGGHVEHGHDGERAQDPARHGALRVAGLLRGGGHDVEADEREEHQGCRRQQPIDPERAAGTAGQQGEQRLVDAGLAGSAAGLRDERAVVGGLDVEHPEQDHEQHDRHLDRGDHQVDPRGKLGTKGKQRGEHDHDEQRSPVQGEPADLEAGLHAAAEEIAEHGLQVDRPTLGDGPRGDRELKDQIPADDPRQQLAEGGVGVGVRAAGHRHGRGELGVAQGSQRAGDRSEHERDRDRGPGHVARDTRGQRENPGADHHRDPEHGQVPSRQLLAQLGFRLVGVGYRLFNRLRSPQTVLSHALTVTEN
jgi:hypothetical protein